MTTGDGGDFWDRFHTDRSMPIPFFLANPDENPATYLDDRGLAPGGHLALTRFAVGEMGMVELRRDAQAVPTRSA